MNSARSPAQDDRDKRTELEKTIVRKLIRELKKGGFLVGSVYMYEGLGGSTKVRTTKAVIETVFADGAASPSCTVHFDRGRERSHQSYGVYLVQGNGRTIISDWHCNNPRFAKIVERVLNSVNPV